LIINLFFVKQLLSRKMHAIRILLML